MARMRMAWVPVPRNGRGLCQVTRCQRKDVGINRVDDHLDRGEAIFS